MKLFSKIKCWRFRRMAGMATKMKAKAIKATSATRSTKVVKRIPRCDVVELNRTMEPVIRQNERERVASEQAVAGSIFGGKLLLI